MEKQHNYIESFDITKSISIDDNETVMMKPAAMKIELKSIK